MDTLHSMRGLSALDLPVHQSGGFLAHRFLGGKDLNAQRPLSKTDRNNISESRYISQTVTDPEITGGALRKNEFCSTDGEAQRWAYGYLRAANKTAHTGTIQLLQQSAYAAGSVISLSGFDEDTNGMWFVWGVDQDAVNARTTLHLRRPLSY